MAGQHQESSQLHYDADLYTGQFEAVPPQQSVVGKKPVVKVDKKHDEIMQAIEAKAAPHNKE